MQRYFFIFFCLIGFVFTLDNGVGLTPPMGWNSWNHFGCNITQDLIKQTADLLVSTGLAAKGYVYVNLDDCWQASRDQTTNQIIPDANFPSGIAALSDYVHSKNLLFGLYSDAGTGTCQNRPGSLGFQQIDAQTYAKWKQFKHQNSVDYLKYDNCNTDGSTAKIRYPVMRDALNKTGRKIFYSMCQWGNLDPATWAGPVANSWRTTGDIRDSWASFLSILDKQHKLQKYAGPGAWNDPDMLQVGNGGMRFPQYEAHFALWCALKAPLLIGADLSTLSDDQLALLGNEELISINQDPLGIQASRFKRQTFLSGDRDYFAGKLSGNRYVVILLNRQIKPADMEFSLHSDMGLPLNTIVSVRDVLKHQQLGLFTDTISFTNIDAQSCRAFIFTIKTQNLNIE